MAQQEMTKQEAVREMARRGREIVRAGYAQDLAQAFGKDVRAMGLVYNVTETGVDWGARVELWETGDAVAISSLAGALCSELKVPLVKYDTGYTGSGRRSAALTAQAVISLEVHFGLAEHAPCDLCGSYDTGQGRLCWVCGAMVRRDYDGEVTEYDAWGRDKEYWVHKLDDGYCESFHTAAQAEEFAALMRRAQEELRELYPAA